MIRLFNGYRFRFQPLPGVSHFQVAENSNSSRTGSRFHELPSRASTSRRPSIAFATEGRVTYEREAFGSHPIRSWSCASRPDKSAGYTGTVRLTDAHSGKITAGTQRL